MATSSNQLPSTQLPKKTFGNKLSTFFGWNTISKDIDKFIRENKLIDITHFIQNTIFDYTKKFHRTDRNNTFIGIDEILSDPTINKDIPSILEGLDIKTRNIYVEYTNEKNGESYTITPSAKSSYTPPKDSVSFRTLTNMGNLKGVKDNLYDDFYNFPTITHTIVGTKHETILDDKKSGSYKFYFHSPIENVSAPIETSAITPKSGGKRKSRKYRRTSKKNRKNRKTRSKK
jgi:hypothetical protein